MIFQFLYWTTLVLDESFNHLSILCVFQLALISILIFYILVIYFIVFFSCLLSSVSSFTCQFHYESVSWHLHNKKFIMGMSRLFLIMGMPIKCHVIHGENSKANDNKVNCLFFFSPYLDFKKNLFSPFFFQMFGTTFRTSILTYLMTYSCTCLLIY